MAKDPAISIVIPARNEAAHLPALLAGLEAQLPPPPASEVIVVDNGSTDDTALLAEAGGARVLREPAGTVAALRNRGATEARGRVLAFLDADMRVTPAWGARLPEVVARLEAEPNLITGSRAGIDPPGSWIERSWFEPLARAESRYMNSGHLIMSAELFRTLGGFSTGLETGEDADLGARAVAAGARIEGDPHLAVIHRGYPKTLRAFVRRELWHGKGDAAPGRLWRSRVALVALGVLALHGVALAGLLAGAPGVAAAAAGLVALACLGASAARYRREPLRTRLANAFLFYWYFVARGVSALVTWLGRAPSSGGRTGA